MSIKASCHCGSVEFKLNDTPEYLTKCNCSICSKLGVIWAHTLVKNVEISMPKDATLRYTRGEASLAFHTCKTCGCTTHWENLKTGTDLHMAVNMRLLNPINLAKYRVRNFDGADSWSYLD